MAQENPFRPEYRELKESEQIQVERIKTTAFELMKLFPVGRREASLAQTNLEQAVMWAVKAVTA